MSSGDENHNAEIVDPVKHKDNVLKLFLPNINELERLKLMISVLMKLNMKGII